MKSWVTFTYEDGTRVVCEQGTGAPSGLSFEGEKGTLDVTRGKLELQPAELREAAANPGPVRLEVSTNHHANWLEAIRSRRRPIADVAIGHRSATVCHLGNIALRVGRPIRWDPIRQEILGDTEAQAMLSRPYRAPWQPV
jgi:hypothetical protein